MAAHPDFWVGRRVEIKPAYNSDTGERDIWDEVAGCGGRIVDVNNDDTVEVDIPGLYQASVHVRRLILR